jgi:all-trans-8'-apo-beta-carotenal 15,15'-oxygenase
MPMTEQISKPSVDRILSVIPPEIPSAIPSPIPSASRGHEPQHKEFSYWATDIEGDLPKNLSGTFFRNGPGRLKIGDQQYGHWFDGDGQINAFSFIDGKVHFKNRFVRTPKYIKETASQKIEYRGFGTQRPGGVLANAFRPPANPANTNTIYHGGHLLALNEGGKPYKLDPRNLHTVGEYTYEGALGASHMFSAHGKIEPKSGYYFNYGSGFSLGSSGLQHQLNLYRIAPSGKLDKKGILPLDSFPFCHDFAMSDKYAVFFINSIVAEGLMDVVLGKSTLADSVGYRDHIPMQIIVVELDTFKEVRRFQCEPGAMIHFGNAWQHGDELFVDGMYADNFDANEMIKDVFSSERFGGGQYRRYRLNLATGTADFEVMTTVESEFPSFNPLLLGQQNELTFTACSVENGHTSFYNGIQSLSRDGEQTLVTLEPGYYGSEPLFALANDSDEERDGYILELLYNAFEHRSELAIFSAANIKQQLCRIKLDHHIPHQFHGFFTRETFAV